MPNQASGSWTAASGNLSIAVSGTTPLAGSYSLNYASSAATTAGDMLISDAFTIDREDLAKPLTVKFYYEPTVNPSNGNFSGTTSNSFSVQIYDVTNAVWIQPAGTFGMTQGSGPGYCTATFQTSSTSQSYRLAISNANASAGAITIKFDDFSVSPQTAPIGAPMSDWETFTPALNAGAFGTVTAINARKRRVGSGLEMEVSFTTGTVAGGAATMTLPDGLNGVSGSGTVVVGRGSGTAATSDLNVLYDPATPTLIGFKAITNGTALTIGTGTGDFNGATRHSFFAHVPILGWSSNVQMSSDTDTRVVQFSAFRNADQTGVNPNNSDVKLTFNTLDSDTHAAFDTTNSRYVVPVTGYYNFIGRYSIANTNVLASRYSIKLYKNGSQIADMGDRTIEAASVGFSRFGSFSAYAVAGDYFELYIFGAGNNSASTLTATAGTGNTYIQGFRLSGPSVIASNEAVLARASGNPASATSGNPIIIPTTAYDTHGAYNTTTGRYTAPVSGYYRVHGTFTSANAAGITMSAYVNAVSILQLGFTDSNGEVVYTGTVKVNAGDLIDVRPDATFDAQSATVHYERIG